MIEYSYTHRTQAFARTYSHTPNIASVDTDARTHTNIHARTHAGMRVHKLSITNLYLILHTHTQKQKKNEKKKNS